MADRIATAFLGFADAIIAGCLIYGLATDEVSGRGYAALASSLIFAAVALVVRLALLGVKEGDSNGG